MTDISSCDIVSMPVSDEDITKRLQELLETVDMETTSGRTAIPLQSSSCTGPQSGQNGLLKHVCMFAERKLREMLEAEFSQDLKERKAIIRQEVRQAVFMKAGAQRNATSICTSLAMAHLDLR